MTTAHFCQISNLSYLQAGNDGDAVVLLHGWGGFKELWWSTLRQVGGSYRTFAPDMPGHGNSPLGNTTGMAQIAARIGQFCEARGLREITLVGHSMGGNVAIELAFARPDLVRRLVLVAPAVQGKQLPIYTRLYLAKGYGYPALRLASLASRTTRQLGLAVPHEHGGGMLLPALRRIAYNSFHNTNDLHQLLRALIGNALAERAAQISVPTLVISGKLDPLVPRVLSRQLAAAIPGARYHEIRAAAHNPMDERPNEFSAVLLGFLHELM